MFTLQDPTYPSIQQQARSPSWSIRISAYQYTPHWKGWVKFSLRFHICLTLSSLDANIQPNTLCVAQHHLSSVLFYFVCCRKPLRSAVCLCQMMTLGRRMIAALWPVCGPPFWALIGREASLAARELSREVIVMDYSADGTEKNNICKKLHCNSAIVLNLLFSVKYEYLIAMLAFTNAP